jgi:CDP-diacylglycerol--glycerol-3-phosphate 3-phosphatidyltransferase
VRLAWLPNALTVARLVAVVPFAVLLAGADDGVSDVAATLFVAASLTDYLDGWLARNVSGTSRFGRIVDPLADRLLIDVALVLLVVHGRLPWWLALPVLARDALLAAIFTRRRAGTRVEVNFAGKLATAEIMAALALLMLTAADWPLLLFVAGLATSLAAAVLYYRHVPGGLPSRPS